MESAKGQNADDFQWLFTLIKVISKNVFVTILCSVFLMTILYNNGLFYLFIIPSGPVTLYTLRCESI